MARVPPTPALTTNVSGTGTNIPFLSVTSMPTLSSTRSPRSLLRLRPFLSFSCSSSASSALPLPRVSTATVKYASPAPEFDFHAEVARLRSLRDRLSGANSLSEKLSEVGNDSRVRRFFIHGNDFAVRVLRSLGEEDEFLVKCLVAAGQEHVLGGWERVGGEVESGRSAVKSALYVLVETIERMGVNNNGNGNGNVGADKLEEEDFEVGELRKLVKMLREVDRFYDCLGGIIG